MTQQQNDRKGQIPPQQPGQQQPGFQPEHEGKQPYGKNEPATNVDRDRNPTNAGNQGRSEHPDFDSRREGQQQQPGNDRPQQPNDPNSMKNVDNVIPEVPPRKEEREHKTPVADPAKEHRTDKGTDKGTIDDSSKFSE